MDENKLQAAFILLVDILQAGPREFETVQEALNLAGISERTARTAKTRLGITSEKSGGRGSGWRWSLPGEILQYLKPFAAFECLQSLPAEIHEQVQSADRFAIIARLLDRSGNSSAAAEFRNRHDQIYEQLLTGPVNHA